MRAAKPSLRTSKHHVTYPTYTIRWQFLLSNSFPSGHPVHVFTKMQNSATVLTFPRSPFFKIHFQADFRQMSGHIRQKHKLPTILTSENTKNQHFSTMKLKFMLMDMLPTTLPLRNQQHPSRFHLPSIGFCFLASSTTPSKQGAPLLAPFSPRMDSNLLWNGPASSRLPTQAFPGNLCLRN